MLRVNNLVKKYGKLTAVNDLSLEIGEGHIFGFVGANGAGKTSTMKIIAGLMPQNSGEVTVDGIDITVQPRRVKRKIGYMPDFFGVYDNLKVSEYMDFYSGLYGIPHNERMAAASQLLELVNLGDKSEFYVDALSRGMKQRLCLARSLIHNPRLLVLDEPASGLDPRARVEMKGILKELKNMGKTVLISSHILPELAELCTMIGIIDQGRMVVSGTVDEIMRRIKSPGRIRIRVTERVEDAVKILQEQPSLGGIEVIGNSIEVDFKGEEKLLPDILKRLVSQDIQVASFTGEGGTLESVFMHLTEGGNNNDA